MTWRSDDSRSGVPSVPRKYFWATMLVAFSDHVDRELDVELLEGVGAVLEVRDAGVAALPLDLVVGVDARGSVKCRRIPIPTCSGAIAMCRAPSSGAVGARSWLRMALHRRPCIAEPQHLVVAVPCRPRDGGALQHCNYMPCQRLSAVNVLVRAAFAKVCSSCTDSRAGAPLSRPLRARSSSGARRPRARSRRGPRSPCRPRRSAGRRPGRGPRSRSSTARPTRSLATSPPGGPQLLLDLGDERVDRRRRRAGPSPRARSPARSLARSNGSSRPSASRTMSGDLLDPLVGGVAAPAREALAPAPDRGAVVGRGASRRPCRRSPGSTGSARIHRSARAPPSRGRRDAPDGHASPAEPGDRLARAAPRAVPRAVDERVDDRARIGAGREALRRSTTACRRARRRRCSTVRAALGGGEGGPAERRTRLRRRQHEPKPSAAATSRRRR